VIFVPRDYGRLITRHIQDHPRCNVFASPGIGKTVSTLVALDVLALTADTFPLLVLGPKRVANSVWSREVAKWAQLRHLRVVKLTGTAAERRAALRSGADIFTIHYGLLKWLTEELQGRWPFKTVIADESTRLKGQRCSYRKHPKTLKTSFYAGGSINAAELARVAHRSSRWVNLTGTPAPNGLKDLWGPHWFIDYGASLGHSYDAFTRRWFMQRRGTSAEQSVFDPLPHAHDEITSRIAPTTVSLNAYDWFDCERPREVVIDVELSDTVMKQYRKLHNEAVLKLSEEVTITAVNAGVITNKCLQLASGHLFDENRVAHHIHDEKLDALESLFESQCGAPLLVGYSFTPDRDAILKRFPQAELLPSDDKAQAEVEDRWNRGLIPMLVVHPASAGHGLNLQYGGCDLCFYSQTWDLELREQLIERIGPVRQMQAGLNRVVNVYNLIAERTFDKVVFDRSLSKATVQQAIMEAVRA
jgi:SNF2 family DNA or RNA helicase